VFQVVSLIFFFLPVKRCYPLFPCCFIFEHLKYIYKNIHILLALQELIFCVGGWKICRSILCLSQNRHFLSADLAGGSYLALAWRLGSYPLPSQQPGVSQFVNHRKAGNSPGFHFLCLSWSFFWGAQWAANRSAETERDPNKQIFKLTILMDIWKLHLQ